MYHYDPDKTLTIKILAILEKNVENGAWSFNHMLDAVRNWRGFGYRFEVDEHIHRNNSITEKVVRGYDQLWFFGTASSNDCLPLTGEEITVIAAMMDDGAGVFATGDHEAIGACLCGKIPRVAGMRVWGGADSPSQLPASSYNSSVRSPYRDVVDYGRTVECLVDTETDDHDTAAKQIWATIFDDYGSLHELLQLGHLRRDERFWIRFLPDHMHEGRLYDFSAGAAPSLFVQDPGYKGPLPRIAAYANRIDYDAQKRAIGFVKYPVVSAYEPYDEHYDEPYGRWGNIVVDSTFHHWTDSNAMRLRFSPTWLHVEQYAINIANWLLGSKGRRKVYETVRQYVANIPDEEDDRSKILELVEKGVSKEAVGWLYDKAGRRLNEHRIVVDTLDRILFKGILKRIANAPDAEVHKLVTQRWKLPEGLDAQQLRREGKLQNVLIGLTFTKIGEFKFDAVK